MFVIYRDRYLPSGGRDRAFQSSLVYYRDNCWNPSTDTEIACGEPEAGQFCQQDSFLQFPSSWGSYPSEGGEVFQLSSGEHQSSSRLVTDTTFAFTLL